MNNEKKSLDKFIMSSKLSVTKNFLYFLIAPIIILIIGIILACTIGFNLGIDFSGGYTFKIYVNNDGMIKNESVVQYDLSNNEDYNNVYTKIETVLNNNGLDIIEYKTTSITVNEYNISAGQAVEIVFQNNTKDAETLNQKLHSDLVNAFNYDGYDNAITSIDEVLPTYSFNWVVGLVSAVVFGFLVAIIYLASRYNISASIITLLQVALDLFVTLSLIVICQLTINLNLGITLLTTFMLSLFNVFFYYNKIKDNFKTGKYENMNNSNIADLTAKEMTFKKSIIYIALFIISAVFSILAVEGVREVALGIMIALIVTYYNSQFILPSLWATIFKTKKKKNKK